MRNLSQSVMLYGLVKGSIVGASSVVTKCVEDYSIVGGNPARLIRMRSE